MTTFLSNYDYVSSVLEYDQQVIASLLESKEELKKTRSEYDASIQAKKTSLSQLEEEQLANEALLEAQDAIINKINADAGLKQEIFNKLQAEEAGFEQSIQDAIKRQEEELKQQQQQQQQQQSTVKPPVLQPAPNVSNDGSFMWPLTTGVISSSFGGH